MKKIVAVGIILTAIFVLIATGCTSNKADTSDSGTSSSTRETQAQPSKKTEDTIIDLTKLSSTMLYSEVYNMTTQPEGYVGKTVKMRGQFSVYHDEELNKDYFAVVIADATACCSQGIEFVWNGEHSYPGDYPAQGTEIEVSGIFGTYVEDGTTYCQIATDSIAVIKE